MSQKKKNKKSAPQQMPFSEKKFIIEAARKLPIHQCWVNKDWKTIGGMAVVQVVRKRPTGRFLVGIYIVDLFCLGVKNTLWKINVEPDEIDELIASNYTKAGQMPLQIDSQLAFNIVWGGVEYAEELGFEPQKDFETSQYILDPIESIEFIDVQFGHNGKPYYFAGPYDNPGKVIAKLEKAVGKGNFECTVPLERYRPDPFASNATLDDDDEFEDDEEEIEYEEVK